nr:unnamed protein product [Callosobruchus chinensis]
MAMLLRTSKQSVALFLRVICVFSVVVTYLIIDIASREVKNGDTEKFFGRQLLSVGENINGTLAATAAETRTGNGTAVRKAENCTPPAILEFPPDGLTREQRKHGWVLLHCVLACYCFTLLAIVCDDYFVPAIKKFCDKLHMKEDIAGATFMATAASSPELFINCVGTFVTEGDLGVGTIVGSAVFNILAVPACCGLFANIVLDLEWWPLTRDSAMYALSVILLIITLHDGRVYFYEALVLVLVYTLYVLMMCFNGPLNRAAHKAVAKMRRRNYYVEVLGETHPLLIKNDEKFIQSNDYSAMNKILDCEMTLKDCEDLEESTEIWKWPKDECAKGQIWWVLTWPISFILYITTPDCRKNPRMFIVTFIMCIFWIGTTSYTVAWLITIIGDTLNIPDSVMGLTFLAAGTSVPEAVSSVIVTKLGHGTMGLSSSIASNTFDILLCLGIPWMIKTAFYLKNPDKNWIQINSAGINFSACALLSTIILLYISLYVNKFKLDWKIGLTCLLIYAGFLIFATVVEMNVFFVVNLPTCDR